MAKYRVLFADATHRQDDDPEDASFTEIAASRFYVPPSDIQIERWHGGWIEFLVWFSFEASGPSEIRSEAERIIQTCGRDVEVFSVLDEKDNVVLTEEELWT